MTIETGRAGGNVDDFLILFFLQWETTASSCPLATKSSSGLKHCPLRSRKEMKGTVPYEIKEAEVTGSVLIARAAAWSFMLMRRQQQQR